MYLVLESLYQTFGKISGITSDAKWELNFIEIGPWGFNEVIYSLFSNSLTIFMAVGLLTPNTSFTLFLGISPYISKCSNISV